MIDLRSAGSLAAAGVSGGAVGSQEDPLTQAIAVVVAAAAAALAAWIRSKRG